MVSSMLRALPIFLGSMYALGMGLFHVVNNASYSGAMRSLPDPGPYIMIGIIGAAVFCSFISQERRIQELERELRKQGDNAKTDAGPG